MRLALPTENIAVEEDGRVLKLAGSHGIMIWLHFDGTVSVVVTLDQHYPEIHPNCYAPADLTEVYRLKGGGSGTAVFHGRSPEVGSIVMKHGGAKDTREVFSLVTIRQELIKRGQVNPEAAEYMRVRIPEFVMVYLSPHHVRDRQYELWATLRKEVIHKVPSSEFLKWPLAVSRKQPRRESLLVVKDEKRSRQFSIASADELDLDVSFKEVEFHIPGLQADGTVAGGVETLISLGAKLALAQDHNNWKVTLAQKTIGGEISENGALVLTSGKLHGELLETLITEFTLVMRNLEILTTDEERGCVESIRREVAALQKSRDVTKVSKELDSFVGSAIMKNFKPVTGRFAKLRLFGQLFRSFRSNSDFFLTESEEIPAKFLGRILEFGACPHKVFSQPPSSRTALDIMENRWLDILNHASSLDSRSATARIWTCGLTDAGLHNTFLSISRGLELFDLGEPRFVPQPAFLTKFLMSFFHTLGMEENGTCWVNRFDVVDGRVTLTPETKTKLTCSYNAYSTASDHFVKELFGDDKQVSTLLVKYVVLQLLSDAAFCLERWEMKGGGTERYGERVEMCISPWLWRSLWDIYISSHVYATLLDPSFMPDKRLEMGPFESAISWWVERLH